MNRSLPFQAVGSISPTWFCDPVDIVPACRDALDKLTPADGAANPPHPVKASSNRSGGRVLSGLEYEILIGLALESGDMIPSLNRFNTLGVTKTSFPQVQVKSLMCEGSTSTQSALSAVPRVYEAGQLGK